MSVVVTHQ